jgi:hypothetical protein
MRANNPGPNALRTISANPHSTARLPAIKAPGGVGERNPLFATSFGSRQLLGQQPHRPELEAVFNQMVQRLAEVVPDLGQNVAGDSTSLKARKSREDAPAK